jgi:hypothetical protein
MTGQNCRGRRTETFKLTVSTDPTRLAIRSPCTAGFGIENPDVLDAEGDVIVDAVLKTAQPVFRRKNFDHDQLGMLDDRLPWSIRAEHRNIWHTESRPFDLRPYICHRPHAPCVAVLDEEMTQQDLQIPVIVFAQVPLLDFSVNVVAVGPVTGVEILLYRHDRLVDGKRGHGDIMLPNRPANPMPLARSSRADSVKFNLRSALARAKS